MQQFDDDETTASLPATAILCDDEAKLVRSARDGDEQAFDLLYDRYFRRVSWYFGIFGQRKAKQAVKAVLTELFGSLGERSDLSFAERAYRLACATELKLSTASDEAIPKRSSPARVATPKHRARTLPSRA